MSGASHLPKDQMNHPQCECGAPEGAAIHAQYCRLYRKVPKGPGDPGSWMDQWGACKVCGGEIPHGHDVKCDVYEQEKEIRRLTAERDEWRSMQQREIDTIQRLRAKLGRIAAGGSASELVWIAKQTLLTGDDRSPDETKERQYKGTRDSFYCPDCQCPKCGNTRPQPGTAMVNPLIGAAAQPSPGTWGVFCAVHGYREWHTKCPQCELSEKAGDDHG